MNNKKPFAGEEFLWQAITFGQSTDLDYNSTILTEKIGTNYVYSYDKALNLAGEEPLESQEPAYLQDVVIESRGGKISAAHDGLTFYYTEVPTDKNFVLTATVRIEQMGPENAAANHQEGAGLMVRDVIGGPRQVPLWEGYEEYPAASNVAGIWVDAASKTIDGDLTIKHIARYGVDSKVGTGTSKFVNKDTNWLKNLDLAKPVFNNDGSSIPDRGLAGLTRTNRYEAVMMLQLERTDETYIIRMLDEDGHVIAGKEANYKTGVDDNVNSNIVENIQPDVMYVGFFAARNARASFSDATLSVSEANTVEYPQYVPEDTEKAALFQASGSYTNNEAYNVQGLTNFDGDVTITQIDGRGQNELGTISVTGGVQFGYPAVLTDDSTLFQLDFVAAADIETSGTKTASIAFQVKKEDYPVDLYVSPSGTSDGLGTGDSPMDMDTAIQKLVPGGSIYAAEGIYGNIRISLPNSGSENKRKALIAQGNVVVKSTQEYLFILDTDYWDVRGFEVDGESRSGSRGLYIYGSHNTVKKCVVHSTSSDAGVCITGSGIGRSAHRTLWPSDNLIENVESYNHVDGSEINADGFAAKSQCGDYNTFRKCVAYGNADDGWDLFNKLAEGKNGTAIIENCIAFNNKNNGFKLGGESLPVRHEVRNCVSYHNGLDGFTDNFNPGDLIIENNTSFDNVRFNYIFRPSPYIFDEEGHITANGTKINNVSYKSVVTAETYSDKVFGDRVENNFFINDGVQTVCAEDFVSLDENLSYQFVDGELFFGDFLRLKADSQPAQAGAGAHTTADTDNDIDC